MENEIVKHINAENLRFLFIGIGISAGVIVFMFGIILFLLKDRFKKYSSYDERITDCEKSITVISNLCHERHRRHIIANITES
jgi:hypothetical protein